MEGTDVRGRGGESADEWILSEQRNYYYERDINLRHSLNVL